MLNRTFGCVRVVWNRTLAWRHQRYHAEQVKTNFTHASAYLTAMKATEDLAVNNMVRNRSLAKAISDCGWGTFRQMLAYKTARAGRHLIVIDRWYPSSKTCSACGHLLAELSLNTRTWHVPVLPHPARPGHQRGEEHSCGRSCRRHRRCRCLRS